MTFLAINSKIFCTKYFSRRIIVAKFSSCSLEKLVFILASPSEKFDLKGDNSWRVYDCFTRLLTCFFFRGNSCFRSVLLAFLRIKVALPALCLFTLFSEYFLKMPISPQPKAPTLYYCLGPSETGTGGINPLILAEKWALFQPGNMISQTHYYLLAPPTRFSDLPTALYYYCKVAWNGLVVITRLSSNNNRMTNFHPNESNVFLIQK